MLYATLQVLTVMLTAGTAAFSLAHACEFPGKKRLDKDAYLIVQQIYYPGFTISGFVEIASQIAALVLLILSPLGTPVFWLTLVAFIGLVSGHAIYWVITHPINRVWLKGQELGDLGEGFFAFAGRSGSGARALDWTALRDRWEYSHVARAALASISLLALVVALAIS